jgi:hypothetical protein
MTGFEYELNQQRQAQARNEADAHRQANAVKPSTSTLRQALGRQLVKLGERLQANTQTDTIANPMTAYDTL